MYVTTGGGYAVGTNEYGDLAKEQRFIADEPYTIHNIIFWVGALEGTSATADKQVSCHNGIDAQTSTEAGPLGAVSISLVFDEYYA